MSVTDKDIYICANIVIEKHGDGAMLEAMKKQAHFASRGDFEGAKTWQRIADAIEWVQMPADLCGESHH